MNYVENVAKMLGVEMYEHFCLTDYNGKRLKGKFQFTDGIDYMSNSDTDKLIYMEI